MNWLVEVTALLAAATIAVPLFRRLGLGDVLGYLAAGVIIGPFGLDLVGDVRSVLQFAEIGVVFLLFIIGLELQPERLRVFRRLLLGYGLSQVLLSAALLGGLAAAWGLPGREAIVIGGALALSSTAFSLKLLAERNELLSPHGRRSFAVLLFQDLAVIPMLLALPILGAGGAPRLDAAALLGIAKVTALVGGYVVGGRYLLRPLLHMVAAVRSPEVFTAAALLLALGSGLLTTSLGLSMGMGAFLAGVLVADSEYRHQLEADIVPFKGLLLGLFFMAVGMSANLPLLLHRAALIGALTVGFVAAKMAVLLLIGRISRLGRAESRGFALSLAQGGEFAFVLLTAAVAGRVMRQETADMAVLVVTLSMALTPLLFHLKTRLAKPAGDPPFDSIKDDEPEVIIAGFGRFGQIIGRMLRSRKIRFTALEISPNQVDFVRRFGNKIYYGDAARLDLLRSAGADRIKVFVIAVDDMEASVNIAEAVIRNFPAVRIYARARNRQHVMRLRAMGVTMIVRETLLSSLQLGTEVLQGLGLPRDKAVETAVVFQSHDEATLERQFALRDDEAALIQSAKEAARELEYLFEADVPH